MPSVLLDCRWLGHAGAGRITELLLREFVADPPVGDWTLWGDPRRLDGLVFPGATVARWEGRPTRWFGQRDLFRVPPADVRVFLHQIRPLVRGRVVTMFYDTTPLQVARNGAVRELKRLYFRLSARRSQVLLTLSEASRRSIAAELRVRSARILVANPSVDSARSFRVRAARATATRENEVLFVGRFAEHKNLRRLVTAFQASDLRATGGTLRLVGGSPTEVDELERWVARQGLSQVRIQGACSEDELDRLLARSAVLVQPSLIEGYGLPAFEAASIGLPVAVSPTGGMGDLPRSVAEFLDPLDEASITLAIDRAVARRDVPAYVPTGDLRSAVLLAVGVATG